MFKKKKTKNVKLISLVLKDTFLKTGVLMIYVKLLWEK